MNNLMENKHYGLVKRGDFLRNVLKTKRENKNGDLFFKLIPIAGIAYALFCVFVLHNPLFALIYLFPPCWGLAFVPLLPFAIYNFFKTGLEKKDLKDVFYIGVSRDKRKVVLNLSMKRYPNDIKILSRKYFIHDGEKINRTIDEWHEYIKEATNDLEQDWRLREVEAKETDVPKQIASKTQKEDKLLRLQTEQRLKETVKKR